MFDIFILFVWSLYDQESCSLFVRHRLYACCLAQYATRTDTIGTEEKSYKDVSSLVSLSGGISAVSCELFSDVCRGVSKMRLTAFSNLTRPIISSRPQFVHLARTSAPARRMRKVAHPQGWFFFIWTCMPAQRGKMFVPMFFPPPCCCITFLLPVFPTCRKYKHKIIWLVCTP